jgi:hypothetical protein
MYEFPKDPRKIRQRLRRYERELRKEQAAHGFISDGYGKRYLLGPLYLMLGDVDGAVESFEWFERTFPDDIGEPFQYLCWTLALYRSGDLEKATHMLRQTMLSNLYLIPHLLGREQEPLDIQHLMNTERAEYIEYAPTEIWALWDEAALEWVRKTVESPEFVRVRARFIEIERELETERPGPRRSQLIKEMRELQTRGEA